MSNNKPRFLSGFYYGNIEFLPMLIKVKNWYKKLPDRKPWIDLATAVLTIPVLVTVIIINISNLKKDGNANDTNKTSLTPTIIEKVVNQYLIPSAEPTLISDITNEHSFPN